MKKRCFWCNCDPRFKTVPGNLSPHATWCPRYRRPPPIKVLAPWKMGASGTIIFAGTDEKLKSQL